MNIKKRVFSILISLSIMINLMTPYNKDKKQDNECEIASEVVLEEDKVLASSFKYNMDEVRDYFKNQEYLSTDNIDKDKIQQIYNYERKDCPFIFNGNVSSLINKIKQNSLTYAQNNPQYNYLFSDSMMQVFPSEDYTESLQKIYEQYKDELLKDGKYDYELQGQLIFNIALEYIIYNLVLNSTNDLNEDLCKIQNLAIVEGSCNKEDEVVPTFTLGIYNSDTNVIVIDYEYNKIATFLSNFSLKPASFELFKAMTDKVIATLNHELNHVRQEMCEHRKIEQDHTLFNYIVKVNDKSYLDKPIFFETSAESDLYNYEILFQNEADNHFNHSYIYEREDESLLFLLTLFNNKPIDDYYNAIFDLDIKNFYDFFDCHNITDYEEIYRILQAFNNIYRENEEIDKYNNQDYLHFKLEIFTKTLDNFIKYIELNPDFTYEEQIFLYGIIREVIIDNAYMNNLEKLQIENVNIASLDNDFWNNFKLYEYDNNFMEEIDKLNQKFIEYLCYKHNKSTFSVQLDLNKSVEDFNNLDEILEKLEERFSKLKAIIFTTYINNNYNRVINYYKLENREDNFTRKLAN